MNKRDNNRPVDGWSDEERPLAGLFARTTSEVEAVRLERMASRAAQVPGQAVESRSPWWLQWAPAALLAAASLALITLLWWPSAGHQDSRGKAPLVVAALDVRAGGDVPQGEEGGLAIDEAVAEQLALSLSSLGTDLFWEDDETSLGGLELLHGPEVGEDPEMWMQMYDSLLADAD